MSNNTPSNSTSPEELVDLLDMLITQGSGHINVASTNNEDGLKVETVKSTDVCGIKGACCQPTENSVDNE